MPEIPQYVLAIETATSKGSLSLLKDSNEIDHWIGGAEKPLSSELLPQISRLLESAGITLNEIGLLVACSGPGSFTGVRVGLSTAKALQTAAGINAVAITLLGGMAYSARNHPVPYICIVPAGRDEVYWQEFGDGEASSAPKTANIDKIIEVLQENPRLCIATRDLKIEHMEKIKSRSGSTVNKADENIAIHLAEASLNEIKSGRRPTAPKLVPLYIKEFGD